MSHTLAQAQLICHLNADFQPIHEVAPMSFFRKMV